MLTRQMGQPDITSHCLWNATKSEGGSIYSIITRITTETKPISVKKSTLPIIYDHSWNTMRDVMSSVQRKICEMWTTMGMNSS